MKTIFNRPVWMLLVTCLLSQPLAAADAGQTDSATDSQVDHPAGSQRGGWVLGAEQWEIDRNGNSIVRLPVLNTAVRQWIKRYNRQPQVVLTLRYPGGEEGEFWVQELADWLVSLGIPSSHIVMVPGSGADDKIILALE